jgi:hypothetical protein
MISCGFYFIRFFQFGIVIFLIILNVADRPLTPGSQKSTFIRLEPEQYRDIFEFIPGFQLAGEPL